MDHIKQKVPEISIPNYVVKPYGSNASEILSDFNSMAKPVIVRSSSPHEYGDFEGIFESVKDVYSERELSEAIEKVETSALSERAKTYAEQNGFNIDEKIHCIIQEQQTSGLLGAMMRHPNNPNLIYVGCRTDEGRFRNESCDYIFGEKENEFLEESDFHNLINKKDVHKLIDIYRKIDSLKEIAEGYSLFVEFGTNPISIFQARPFKKIETADFELPVLDDEKYSETFLTGDCCFGITPKEGIVLPVLKSVGANEVIIQDIIGPDKKEYFRGKDFALPYGLFNGYFVFKNGMMDESSFFDFIGKTVSSHHRNIEKEINGKYAFVTSSIKGDNWDIDLSIPNAEAVIFGASENFLTHQSLRLIKKAKVSILDGPLVERNFYKNLSSVKSKLRIISNGKEAVAIME